jgi:hypothetical protein
MTLLDPISLTPYDKVLPLTARCAISFENNNPHTEWGYFLFSPVGRVPFILGIENGNTTPGKREEFIFHANEARFKRTHLFMFRIQIINSVLVTDCKQYVRIYCVILDK